MHGALATHRAADTATPGFGRAPEEQIVNIFNKAIAVRRQECISLAGEHVFLGFIVMQREALVDHLQGARIAANLVVETATPGPTRIARAPEERVLYISKLRSHMPTYFMIGATRSASPWLLSIPHIRFSTSSTPRSWGNDIRTCPSAFIRLYVRSYCSS